MIGQGGGGLSSLGRGRYQHVFFVIDFMEIISGCPLVQNPRRICSL